MMTTFTRSQRPLPAPRVITATTDDAGAICDIYNRGIESREATFETRLRKPADIKGWTRRGDLLRVAVAGDKALGFATVFAYRDRHCYRGVGEFSIYVHPVCRATGVGTLLMSDLIDVARDMRYWKLLSRVFPENYACLSMLSKLGFRQVGTYRKHAQLDGRWRDVVIVERLLFD